MTDIVDESKHKLHDILRRCLTVIQFHTPEKEEKHINRLLGPGTTLKFFFFFSLTACVRYYFHSY